MREDGTGSLWVILLAAGDGRRVRAITNRPDGESVPKQFWSVDGQRSLLQRTIERATGLVPIRRVVPVVALQHRRWWERELESVPTENIMIQPQNKGTAAGILLPFLHVVRRDREARILVLPCDHFVADEIRLREAILGGLQVARRCEDRVVLLGMRPETGDPDYGWIVPREQLEQGPAMTVRSFVEKPDRSVAQRLIRHGGLLNSLILVAMARALLQLYDRAMPQLVARFVTWREESANAWLDLEELYRVLPNDDFSQRVLETSSDWLSVLPVSRCGWIDLGSPTRLRSFLTHGSAERSSPTQALSA
jgi:mannose-1-phosphate guanylyltransferase